MNTKEDADRFDELPRTDELTSLMHMEFAKDEDERLEFAAGAVESEVFYRLSISFENALKKYDITEEQFFENMTYKHILEFPKKTLEEIHNDGYSAMTKEIHDRYRACKTDLETCFLFGQIHRESDEKRKRKN